MAEFPDHVQAIIDRVAAKHQSPKAAVAEAAREIRKLPDFEAIRDRVIEIALEKGLEQTLRDAAKARPESEK